MKVPDTGSADTLRGGQRACVAGPLATLPSPRKRETVAGAHQLSVFDAADSAAQVRATRREGNDRAVIAGMDDDLASESEPVTEDRRQEDLSRRTPDAAAAHQGAGCPTKGVIDNTAPMRRSIVRLDVGLGEGRALMVIIW